MIPGYLIALLTFPGVIVHELAHLIFCRLFNVAIYKVVYFQLGTPSGYVEHETPKSAWQSVLISVGPFLINSIVGTVIAFPAAVSVLHFKAGTPLDVFLIWLGTSIAMHAFPSTGDAKCIIAALKRTDTSLLLKALSFPVVGFIYLGSIGSIFWLDLVYGVALVRGATYIASKYFV